MHEQQTAFENIVGKKEIARNEQFLLFPQCFLLNQKIISPFVQIFDIISSFAAALEEPKFAIRGKGLMLVISIFSFSHNGFYPFQKQSLFLGSGFFLLLLSANALNLEPSKILLFGKTVSGRSCVICHTYI